MEDLLGKAGSDQAFSVSFCTVRSKFWVRLRNLVIFEVFGVKFWTKKFDFSKLSH